MVTDVTVSFNVEKEKNEKIPLLIEEKGKLQRGIDLEKEIENLNIDIKELKNNIDINSKEKESLEKKIKIKKF